VALVLLYLTFSWIYTTAAVLYLSTNMKSSGPNPSNIVSNAFASTWFYFSAFSMFHESPICSNLFIKLSTSLLFVVLVIVAFSVSGFPSLLISAAPLLYESKHTPSCLIQSSNRPSSFWFWLLCIWTSLHSSL